MRSTGSKMTQFYIHSAISRRSSFGTLTIRILDVIPTENYPMPLTQASSLYGNYFLDNVRWGSDICWYHNLAILIFKFYFEVGVILHKNVLSTYNIIKTCYLLNFNLWMVGLLSCTRTTEDQRKAQTRNSTQSWKVRSISQN